MHYESTTFTHQPQLLKYVIPSLQNHNSYQTLFLPQLGPAIKQEYSHYREQYEYKNKI